MLKLKSITSSILAVAIAASVSVLPATVKAEEVYVIRGAFNVFSAGMNQMAQRMRSRGINAKAYSNGAWSGLADSIIRRQKTGNVSYPIVIMGHSVGGQEAPKMSNKLSKAGIRVALVIGFDPGFGAPAKFNSGSPRVVNYYIKGSSRGNPYYSTGGFSGSIRNIDIRSFTSADHVGMDKDSRVQARALSQVYATVGK